MATKIRVTTRNNSDAHYALHLIASSKPHDNPDETARILSVHESEEAAQKAGRRYLREHPDAWLQTQPTSQSENGTDVELR